MSMLVLMEGVFVVHRLKIQNVRNLFSMAKEFTWHEFPDKDPDTGFRTMASWIHYIQRLVRITAPTLIISHTMYFMVRALTKIGNGLYFEGWFPVDIDTWPGYIIVLAVQVRRVLFLEVDVKQVFQSVHHILICTSDMHVKLS